jgi:hypothetical protein
MGLVYLLVGRRQLVRAMPHQAPGVHQPLAERAA